MFAEPKKVTERCKNLEKEMIEHNRSRDELLNAMEVLENRTVVLEEENSILKEENRKIAFFAKGLDRGIENIVAYLCKKQDE